MQKDNSKAQEQLQTSLDDLRKNWPTVLPPSKPVFSGDEIAAKVKKIEDTTKQLTSVSTASSSSSAATPATTNSQPRLAKFKGDLIASLAAAKTNDLTQAKKHMTDASDDWQEVEDRVKASSRETYKTIEAGLSDVQISLVIPPHPNQEKSVLALESLLKTVNTYAISSGSK